MKKEASKLMTEEKFWNIIEESHRGKFLEKILRPLSEEELFGFRWWWEYFCYMSFRQDLWAVAFTFMGGCSDDQFDYFHFWLISRGKDIFYKAIENPDSLCNVFTARRCDYPDKESLDYVVMDILEKRTGYYDYYYKARENYSMPENNPELNFEWSSDNLESIRKICPCTFNKWGNTL